MIKPVMTQVLLAVSFVVARDIRDEGGAGRVSMEKSIVPGLMKVPKQMLVDLTYMSLRVTITDHVATILLNVPYAR